MTMKEAAMSHTGIPSKRTSLKFFSIGTLTWRFVENYIVFEQQQFHKCRETINSLRMLY